jgi:hypothetical protein
MSEGIAQFAQMLFQSCTNIMTGLLHRFSSIEKLLIWATGIYEADFPINGQNVDLWCALLRGREATAFSSVYREGSRW